MAHASGNPTWQNYPTLTTPYTAAASENQESAVDQLYTSLFGGTGRTTPQIIDVRYQGTSGGVAAGSDIVLSGNWTTAGGGRDTDGMYNSTGSLYMQAAVPGRFLVWFDCHWKAYSGFQSVKVLKNGTSVTANSILSDSKPGTSGNEGTVTLISRDVILAANDKLYLALYSSVATSVVGVGDAFFGGVFSNFGMRWIAPS